MFDAEPSLSADGLEIYFKSDRAGGQGGTDIWRADRATVDATWSNLAVVAPLASPRDETSPTLSADGLTIWFASERSGGLGGFDIYVARRATRDEPWSIPGPVEELNSARADGGIFVASSGRVAYLHSERLGASTIFRSTRATLSSAWSIPLPIEGLAPLGPNGNPFASTDDCALYFNVARMPGNADIYVARRSAPEEPFQNPTRIIELASAWDDADPWLSDDEQTMIFASARPSGALAFDIYVASRQ